MNRTRTFGTPLLALSLIAMSLGGCADLLGLGDYRDLCKPYGIGDPPDCVYGSASHSSGAGGDAGGHPTSSGSSTGGAPLTRTVTATQSATYVRPNGTKTEPVDLTAFHPGIYVWDGDAYKFDPGTASPQGTFEVDGVPKGDFTVSYADQISSPTVSSLNQVDGSYSVLGRQGATAAMQTSPLTLDVTNMIAWDDSQTIDAVSFSNGAAASYLETYELPPDPGATSWSPQLDWQTVFYPPNLMSTAEGDLLVVAQLAPASASGLNYLSAQRAATLQFAQMDGQTESIPAPLAPVAQDQTLAVTWKTAPFEALATAVSPGATWLANTLDVYAGIQTADGQMVTALQTPRMMELSVPKGTNLDAMLPYGNPYSISVSGYASFATIFSVPVALGQAMPRLFQVVSFTQTKISSNAASATEPKVSPPVAPNVDGVSFWKSGKLDSTTPVLSWHAPQGGGAAGYNVGVWQVGVSGTRTTVSVVGHVLTPRTSLRIPPGLITEGSHVLFIVTAYFEPGVDLEKSPFRSTLPFATAPTVSDVFEAP